MKSFVLILFLFSGVQVSMASDTDKECDALIKNTCKGKLLDTKCYKDKAKKDSKLKGCWLHYKDLTQKEMKRIVKEQMRERRKKLSKRKK